MNSVTDTVMTLLVTYGISIVAAIAILIVGLWISGRVRNLVKRSLERTGKIDPMLSGFLGALAKYLVLTVTVLAVIAQFGIEITSLLVIFGSAGLAVGLALQGTLSNVAAGVMLLIFRPFKSGDYVEVGGHAGTVQTVSLFVTELSTPDNIQIIIPNTQVWGSAVMNYSFHATRRCDLAIGISYADDIEKAKTTIEAVIKGDARAKSDPEPMIAVVNLGDSSVDLTVRVWCDNGDYWGLKFDLTQAIKEALDANGISIPFPTRTVYNVAEAAE
ncbi:MAG: mechanosensitive ion channel [Alphaproteobacteria bacterium]|nr:mechanosensitive ion channel [Alphaproteobacteria bacterium]